MYNQALDEDPDDLKAFERIDKIMTAKKDWKNQERNYRKMIKRLGQEPAARAARRRRSRCGTALGEIYRSRLKDCKSAIAAFEVCVQLDPERRRATRSWPSSISCRARDLRARRSTSTATSSRRRTDFGQMAVYMKTLRGLFMELRQYDQRLVRGGGAGLPAQGRRRGDAVLRAVQAEGLRARARRVSPRTSGSTSITPTRIASSRRSSPTVSQAVAGGARARSTRTGASSARTGATWRPISCCSARCSTTSTRCWACRSRSSTCGPSRRASWIWRTRARRRSWCRRSWWARASCRAVPRRSWPTSSPSG